LGVLSVIPDSFEVKKKVFEKEKKAREMPHPDAPPAPITEEQVFLVANGATLITEAVAKLVAKAVNLKFSKSVSPTVAVLGGTKEAIASIVGKTANRGELAFVRELLV
jgi:hypothetical protein